MRILHIGLCKTLGGIERFLINVYNHASSDIAMDFVTTADSFDYDLNAMMQRDHAYRVLQIPPLSRPLRHFQAICDCIEAGGYDIVHIHKNSLANPLPLLAAKRCARKGILLHAHNTQPSTGRRVGGLLHRVNRALAPLRVTRLACSEVAGKWLFGGRDYTVIHNAIDIGRFTYRTDVRARMRQELGLVGHFAIGAVARISDQKNQLFMLDVLREILRHDSSAVLVLAGGHLDTAEGAAYEAAVREKIRRLGLADAVRLLGVREDAEGIYQALDAFFLPSKYEGLCISAIEAQAAGLPCVVSEALSDETKVSSDYRSISLFAPVAEWSDALLSCRSHARRDARKELERAGYGMAQEIAALETVYRRAAQEGGGCRRIDRKMKSVFALF